jgi:hypothetical protein
MNEKVPAVTSTTQQRQVRGERRAGLPSSAVWALVALVVTVVVVGAVAGTLRAPTPLDEQSPEGVVQAYLQAVLDGDHLAAVAFFSDDTARDCQASDFRNAWVPESLTATLDAVHVRGDDATVRVRLRTVAGPGPFGGDGYSSLETLTLAREDAQWRITGAPWPLLDCRRTP